MNRKHLMSSILAALICGSLSAGNIVGVYKVQGGRSSDMAFAFAQGKYVQLQREYGDNYEYGTYQTEKIDGVECIFVRTFCNKLIFAFKPEGEGYRIVSMALDMDDARAEAATGEGIDPRLSNGIYVKAEGETPEDFTSEAKKSEAKWAEFWKRRQADLEESKEEAKGRK